MARAKAMLESVPTPTDGSSGARATGAGATAAGDGARRGTSYERRYRQTVRSIDVWSVLKISLCFYMCALIVVLAGRRRAVVDRVGGRGDPQRRELRRRPRERQRTSTSCRGRCCAARRSSGWSSCACSS